MEKSIKEKRLTELRSIENENNEMIVEGYAVVFNQVTDLGWCKEVIDRNAFSDCDMSDCCFNYNHGENGLIILARTRNNSLELKLDDVGLKIRARIIDTTDGRDIYKSIQEGLLDKMSFAFTVREQTWDYETDTRKITKIDKLYDVSVVDIPAYDGTSIFARSKEEYEEEKRQYEELKLEKEKLKLKMGL